MLWRWRLVSFIVVFSMLVVLGFVVLGSLSM